MRKALLILFGAATGCGPAPPAPGHYRIDTEKVARVVDHAGKTRRSFTLLYAGTKQRIEWGTELWALGKPVRPARWTAHRRERPDVGLQFELSDAHIKGEPVAAVEGEVAFVGWDGGGTRHGTTFFELRPVFPHVATVRSASNFAEIPDGDETILWGVFGDNAPIEAPDGTSLESLAAKVGWAVLVRVRLSP